MKFLPQPVIELGSKREIVKFAYLPKKLSNGIIIWWEFYLSLQEYVKEVYSDYNDYRYIKFWKEYERKESIELNVSKHVKLSDKSRQVLNNPVDANNIIDAILDIDNKKAMINGDPFLTKDGKFQIKMLG